MVAWAGAVGVVVTETAVVISKVRERTTMVCCNVLKREREKVWVYKVLPAGSKAAVGKGGGGAGTETGDGECNFLWEKLRLTRGRVSRLQRTYLLGRDGAREKKKKKGGGVGDLRKKKQRDRHEAGRFI